MIYKSKEHLIIHVKLHSFVFLSLGLNINALATFLAFHFTRANAEKISSLSRSHNRSDKQKQ